jgi:hypothetical protein
MSETFIKKQQTWRNEMEHTLNYEILSEELFIEGGYQFEIEINDVRLTKTKTFTLIFEKIEESWFKARFDADDSQKLIDFCGDSANKLVNDEILKCEQVGNKFIRTRTELDEKRTEMFAVLNSGYSIISQLNERMENYNHNN